MNDSVAYGSSAPVDPGVVVGVDGSEQSLRAAHWAAAEAHRRGLRLTVVTAYSIPAFAASSMDGGYAMMDDDSLRQGAERVLDEAKEFLRDYPGDVSFVIESGDPTAVLLEYSRAAHVLVVGSRGRGGFLGRLLGSVSSALPAHSTCPTVVVPLRFSSKAENAVTSATGAIPVIDPNRSAEEQLKEAAQTDGGAQADSTAQMIRDGAHSLGRRDPRPVAVGVDGSDYGRVAALMAAQEAAERGTKLRLVCALPPLGATLVWIPTQLEDTGAVEELEEKLDAGKRWVNSHYPDVEIECEVVNGTAVDVLVEETRHAQLSVLGTRGRGGFAGMLLGSTSQGVLQHSEGPLMVVPEGEDQRIDNRSDFGPVL